MLFLQVYKISSRGSRSTARSFKSSAFISCNISQKCGKHLQRTSKGSQVSWIGRSVRLSLLISRSKSYTGDRYSLISSREIACSFNSCNCIQTTNNLCLIDQRLLHIFSQCTSSHCCLCFIENPQKRSPFLFFTESFAKFKISSCRCCRSS